MGKREGVRLAAPASRPKVGLIALCLVRLPPRCTARTRASFRGSGSSISSAASAPDDLDPVGDREALGAADRGPDEDRLDLGGEHLPGEIPARRVLAQEVDDALARLLRAQASRSACRAARCAAARGSMPSRACREVSSLSTASSIRHELASSALP